MFITDLPALWRRLRAMFDRAAIVIGAPQTLARLTTLTRQRRHEIAGWIARLECIARKLIFAEAATLAPPAAPALRRVTQTSPTKPPCAPAPDLTQPHTWAARFKLAPPRDPLAVAAAHAPRIRALWGPTSPPACAPPAATQAAPAPLRFAFRLEALRRVLDDPAPYARRLARVLCRLTRRFPQAAARYALVTARPHATDPLDPRLIVEAIAAAIGAAPARAADTS